MPAQFLEKALGCTYTSFDLCTALLSRFIGLHFGTILVVIKSSLHSVCSTFRPFHVETVEFLNPLFV